MATDNSNISPDAANLNNNLTALGQNGHGWLDPTLQVGLAQNAGSTQNAVATADIYQNVMNNTPNSIPNKFMDAVLNTAPGPATTALSTITNTHGPIPFTPEDITSIQKKMQAAGFGGGLPVGTWNPAWQNAWQQHNYAQLTSPGIGNTDSFNLFKSVLNMLSPSYWVSTDVHAVASFIHSLPSTARQIAADSIPESPVEFLGILAKNKGNLSQTIQNEKQYTADIENALGGNVTPEELTNKQMAMRNLQDLANVMSLVLFKGTAASIAKSAGAIGAGLAESAGAEATAGTLNGLSAGAKAVVQNPSLLVTRSLPEEFANAPKLTIVKSLANAAENSANGVGIFSRFTSPVASRVAPALDALASEDGVYYAGKQAIASTMRNPLRSGLSVLQTRGSVLGLGLLGESELQNKLGSQPTFDATKVTPYQGMLGNALNTIAIASGSIAKPLKVTTSLGNAVSATHEAITNALGPIGFDTVLRNALGIKLKDLQKGVGEDFVNDHFIRTKLPQYGASHFAQQAAQLEVDAGKIDRNSEEYQQLVQTYEHEILNDPELRDASVESLVNNPHLWTQMLRNDFIRQFGSLVRKNGVAKKDQQAFFDGLNNLKNGPHSFMEPILDPEVRNLVYGSSTSRAVEDLATQELSSKFGQEAPLYYEGKAIPDLFHGSLKDLKPGDIITPGSEGERAFAARHPGIAQNYVEEYLMDQGATASQGHIYKVEPIKGDDTLSVGADEGVGVTSKKGFKVVSKSGPIVKPGSMDEYEANKAARNAAAAEFAKNNPAYTPRQFEEARAKGVSVESLKSKIFDSLSSVNGKLSPRLMAVHRDVNEFAPNGADLARTTKYGKGIVATEDASIAGRANANVYALRHADPEEQPDFLDLTKNDRTNLLAAKIKGFINNQELNVKPGDITPEYKTLQNLLKNPADATGQNLLDAYRAALRAGGQLNKDQIDQRMDQVTSQFMVENKITGMKYKDPRYGLQTLVRPDKAMANMIKPSADISKDKLLASYLVHNNVNGLGTIGAARKDTILAQDAIREAKKVFSQLKKAGYGNEADAARSTLELEAISKQRGIKMDTTPLPRMENVSEDPKLIKITNNARDTLVKKFDKSNSDLTRLDPVQLASLMWREARLRASEAYLPSVKPEGISDAKWNNIKGAFDEADRKGYRIALGTDIGHGYEKPLLPNYVVNQRTSLLRKAAMRLGFDTTKINDLSVANNKRNNVVDELNEALGKDVHGILGDTGETIYSRLLQGAQSSLFDKTTVTSSQKALKRLQKIQGLDTNSKTYQDLEEELNAARNKEAEISRSAHQIRDLSLKQMVQILQRPIDPADITGVPIPGYSKADAQKLARRVLIGYAKTPASLVGISKAEDFVRASGAMLANQTASFMGEAPLLKKFKIGEGPLINTLASLPNDLARLRDKWRFDNNPIFSFRRLAKTNLKAAIEGVPPTMNPYATLNRMGKVDEAMAILNRTMPDVYKAQKDLEPLEKMLVQNDRFNIYNPGHNMMWQAYNLKQLGKTDAEITAALNKINTYGDRTPLERTVNTIFYPFSFNKTLYRNLGGYLLDNPGHTFLIDAGFNLYSHYNKNNAIGNWVDTHAPLLTELQKLNAFEHGTGLGQFGGINAPYLSPLMNLFSPQRIQPAQAKDAISTITNLVPALSELNKILFNYQASTGKADFKGTAVETGKVGYWALKNLEQHAATLFDHQKRIAYQPMMTDQAQVKAGEQTVTMLKTQLASLMGTANVWPDSPAVPASIRGKKYDASSFGQFAHVLFPAYDPTAGTAIALEKNQKALDYVASLEGTSRYNFYSQFQKTATSAIQKLHKTNDPATIQNIVDPLRQAATYMAESDSQFLSFYNKYYESALGPIEGLSK